MAQASQEDIKGIYELIESRRAEDQKFQREMIEKMTRVEMNQATMAAKIPVQPCEYVIKHVAEHEASKRTLTGHAVRIGFDFLKMALAAAGAILWTKKGGGQ